ncbi:MAG: type IV pilus assembly protein PilM [Deltaproteobacteria bacterium]|nr:type IV pilus assembly protein PilM [Deltaproteobacteria bacterium]MBW2308541.1 type IV pilus assembly protein PilM [Deltaproteobacteria bacterium]
MLSNRMPVVAIDIGTNFIKLVHLQAKRRGHELLSYGTMPLPPGVIEEGAIVDPDVVIQAVKDLMKIEKIGIKNVVTAVSGTSVIIKKIKVPPMSENELIDAIQFEAGQYIPFDIEDVNLDFVVMETPNDQREADQMDVLLVAVTKEKMNELTTILSRAGLKVAVVDVDVFAIENAFGLNYTVSPDDTIALMDIGAGVTNINILEYGISAFTRDIYFGGMKYNEAIMQQLDVDYETAEKLKLGNETNGHSSAEVYDIINSVTNELSMEINRALEVFRGSSEAPITKIMLGGGCARMMGLDQALATNLETQVEIFNPFQTIRCNPKVFDPEYIEYMAPSAAVGVGLALRRFGDR